LQQLPEGQKIDTAIFVAGWWNVDNPWDSLIPWISARHDFDRVRAAVGNLCVLLSDNDPFTSDFDVNAALWKDRLDAQVTIIPDAKHFNRTAEPAVYELLRDVAARM
jgi:hypothetical protein